MADIYNATDNNLNIMIRLQ